MYTAADNVQQKLKLETKRRLLEKTRTLKDQTPSIFADPIKALFKDLSTVQLLGSWWRVLLRICKLQGFRAALRVFPIVWMIVKTVGCFARYHADEYARMKNASENNQDLEESVLTEPQVRKISKYGQVVVVNSCTV